MGDYSICREISCSAGKPTFFVKLVVVGYVCLGYDGTNLTVTYSYGAVVERSAMLMGSSDDYQSVGRTLACKHYFFKGIGRG